MTTTPAPPRPRDDGTRLARARDLVGAEWIKLRSVRSTYWVTLAALATSVGFGALACLSDVQRWDHVAGERGQFDTLPDVFNGFVLAQLVFAAIGVLAITGEFSSGLIGTTFAAAPARRAVLAAKAATVGLFTLVGGAVAAGITFVVSEAILAERNIGQAIGNPAATRALLATTAYLLAAALLGLSLGVLLRHAAAAITALFALLFLGPQLLHGTTGALLAVDNALPGTALRRLTTTAPWDGAPSTVAAWTVIVVYPVVGLTVAALTLHRRDA